ncbi:hypothetical protein Tco_1193094, partial [Tanacetum coccineum]
LKTEFDKIRAAVAELKSLNIKRSLKRIGADLEQASSKKSKSVEVPSQKTRKEDVEVPSNTASTSQHTASSLKKVGTRKKRLGRKGVHISHSTIPIKDGDPEAEHKMCIKYASDTDSASDDDTPVNLYAVVDWELVPTGLGLINVFYRKDNSRKYFTSLREILHLVTRADLMTIYGRVMTFYQNKKVAGVGLVLWGDLKVLMDSPEVNDGSDVWKNQQTWKIQSWKLYSYSGVHVLETVMGNELTTVVQLIAFLKKQISDSRRPKVHDWLPKTGWFSLAIFLECKVASPRGYGSCCCFKVSDVLFLEMVLRCCVQSLCFQMKDLSRNLKLYYVKFKFSGDGIVMNLVIDRSTGSTYSSLLKKHSKEEMAMIPAWIEVMQEELHQFDRLQVWESLITFWQERVSSKKWSMGKRMKTKLVIRKTARLTSDPTNLMRIVYVNQSKFTLEMLKKIVMEKDKALYSNGSMSKKQTVLQWSSAEADIPWRLSAVVLKRISMRCFDVLSRTGGSANELLDTSSKVDLLILEDDIHGPSDAMHNPCSILGFSQQKLYLICHEDTHDYLLSSPLLEIVDIEIESSSDTYVLHNEDGNPA